jgi:hypothetical protein
VLSPQKRLVPFHLQLDFAEGLLAAGANAWAASGGMKSSARKGKRERTGLLVVPPFSRKNSMKLNQVGRIAFQQFSQFTDATFDFGLDWFVRIDVLVTDGNVHGCTCADDSIGRYATQFSMLHRMVFAG